MIDRADAEGLGRDDPGAVFRQDIRPAGPEPPRRRGRGGPRRARQHGLVLGCTDDAPHARPRPSRGGRRRRRGPRRRAPRTGARHRRAGRPSSRARGPRSQPSPRSPTTCAPARSATRSPTFTTATSTTPTSARSSAASAGSPRARSRSTSGAAPTSSPSRTSPERVRRGPTSSAPPRSASRAGIHPDFDGDYYVDVARAVHEAEPDIHIHGFTALEVTEGARRLDEPLSEYLLRLREAGLRTLPGTAAEILDDEVRAVLCPDKITTDEWLEAHETAHAVGLRSNVTIMFGAVEQPVSWARHLVRTRELQRRTGGFTEFVPLPYVHMAAPLYLQRRSRRGPTFREALLMHSVGRIAYRDTIPNVQVSWVKLGAPGAEQILRAGANDLGGTLMDENISRAAGASHGQGMDEAGFRELVEPLGRRLEQRTTLYGRVAVA
ncbi:MAG: CofH family radical SAM protein [Acidimicrobiia bacterium]|nr:CofH family radical SAM protein [Acidimicrobiia bacterium]